MIHHRGAAPVLVVGVLVMVRILRMEVAFYGSRCVADGLVEGAVGNV